MYWDVCAKWIIYFYRNNRKRIWKQSEIRRQRSRQINRNYACAAHYLDDYNALSNIEAHFHTNRKCLLIWLFPMFRVQSELFVCSKSHIIQNGCRKWNAWNGRQHTRCENNSDHNRHKTVAHSLWYTMAKLLLHCETQCACCAFFAIYPSLLHSFMSGNYRFTKQLFQMKYFSVTQQTAHLNEWFLLFSFAWAIFRQPPPPAKKVIWTTVFTIEFIDIPPSWCHR